MIACAGAAFRLPSSVLLTVRDEWRVWIQIGDSAAPPLLRYRHEISGRFSGRFLAKFTVSALTAMHLFITWFNHKQFE